MVSSGLVSISSNFFRVFFKSSGELIDKISLKLTSNPLSDKTLSTPWVISSLVSSKDL